MISISQIHRLAIVIILLLSPILIFAQKAERANVRKGNKLYKTEKYTEAEIAYRKSLEVNPKSVEGAYNLGNSLYKQGKFPEAAEQYQLVVGQEKNADKLSETFHNVGNISMQNKEYAKSVEAYKQSLRLNPKDDETRYNLALAQKLLEDQQQQDQDQDKKDDQNKDQQDQDKNEDQEQNKDQQQQDEKKEDKTQEQPQQNEQMSKDNAQQMLDAFLQDEKDTQEKVKKAQMQQQQRRKTDKEW